MSYQKRIDQLVKQRSKALGPIVEAIADLQARLLKVERRIGQPAQTEPSQDAQTSSVERVERE